MYLRGKFKNILKHRGFPQLLSSWPTDNDIQMFIASADGLFAHSAAVLRHMVYPPDSQFRERLQSVLDSLSHAGKQASPSPFSQPDALYLYIMRGIPESILLSSNFLLFYLFSWNFDTHLYTSMHRCMLIICSRTSVTICMPWFPTRRLMVLSAQLTLASTSHGCVLIKVNGFIQIGWSWYIAFLSQILLQSPPRSHSLWCLLCQHSCL